MRHDLSRLKKFEIKKLKHNKYVMHAIPTTWIERETELKRNRIIPKELTSEEGFGSGMWMVAVAVAPFGESSEEEESDTSNSSSSSHGNGLFISTNPSSFLPAQHAK